MTEQPNKQASTPPSEFESDEQVRVDYDDRHGESITIQGRLLWIRKKRFPIEEETGHRFCVLDDGGTKRHFWTDELKRELGRKMRPVDGHNAQLHKQRTD